MRFAVVLSFVLLWIAPWLPQSGGRIDTDAERARVLAAAARYLKELPITTTASVSPRSPGGPHDFYSDGGDNPAAFTDHQRALVRLSVQMPALTTAFTLTKDRKYALVAQRHARAWFISRSTRMTPSLRYTAAVPGRGATATGGREEGVQLVEVARALERLDSAPGWSREEAEAARRWFADYLDWLTTDPSAQAGADAAGSAGPCWVMQVAAFAHYTGDERQLSDCRTRFKTVLVERMAANGRFAGEPGRPASYADALFTLEAMATICQILSTPDEDLWAFELPDGRGMRRAMAVMVPYLRDRTSWPKAPGASDDARWPMRQASLLFAGVALKRPEYIDLWSSLPADTDADEILRRVFIRQPLLWLD